MPKANLGAKRLCPNCHLPFYDLGKHPAHCPNCGHEFDPTEVLRGRRSRGNEPPKTEEVKHAKAPPGEIPDVGDVPDTEEGEEADEDLLEDASDLGEDEDDMSEVIENVDEGGEER